MKKPSKTILALAAIALLSCPGSARACAACFGKSDSAMAQGMNAGIFALLGVIGTVLLGAASFFVFLARQAAASARKEQDGPSTPQKTA
jgi:heme/copper-type cytochrome/quinol oxidase subunit 2